MGTPETAMLWQPPTSWHCGCRYLYNIKVQLPFKGEQFPTRKRSRSNQLCKSCDCVFMSASICEWQCSSLHRTYMTGCPRLTIGLSVPYGASILTCQTQNIQSPSHPYLKHSRTKAAQMASTLSIPLPPPSQPISLSLNMTASLFNRITTSLTFNTDLRS